MNRDICFGGYLYVLPRYINVCIPEVFTSKNFEVTKNYVEILEEAHTSWLIAAESFTMDDLINSISHVMILKYISLLHRVLKNTEKSINFANKTMH